MRFHARRLENADEAILLEKCHVIVCCRSVNYPLSFWLKVQIGLMRLASLSSHM